MILIVYNSYFSIKGENMIKTKSALKEFIVDEKSKYGLNKKNCIYIYILSKIGFETAILYRLQKRLRLTEYYYNTKKKLRFLISKIKLKKFEQKYSINIPINVFDIGLRIMHLGPIIVNCNAKVGKNCSIHVCTAIAAGGHNSNCPVIGDNVVIGIGAKIIGGINIPNGAAIGANAVVNKSFDEENISIAGVPARKISNNGKITWSNNEDI